MCSGPLRVTDLDPDEWADLLAHSRAEAYGLVERLLADHTSGANRFDHPGEALYVLRDGGRVIACAGLNVRGGVGRVRRVYVLPAWRGQGLGRRLVQHLLDQADPAIGIIAVNVGRLGVGGFYERLGFERVEAEGITHRLSRPATPSTPSP